MLSLFVLVASAFGRDVPSDDRHCSFDDIVYILPDTSLSHALSIYSRSFPLRSLSQFLRYEGEQSSRILVLFVLSQFLLYEDISCARSLIRVFPAVSTQPVSTFF